MSFIRYDAPLRVLAVVSGHAFDRNGFAAMFESFDDVAISFLDQPAAQYAIAGGAMADYEVLLLFDIAGIDLVRAINRQPPRLIEPMAAFKLAMQDLLAAGTGVLALHHALASWPSWPDYGDWLGGRFLYLSAPVRGAAALDSGYRHDVAYDAVVAADHPVTAGLPPRVALRDELYLAEIFTDDITPLLCANYEFTKNNFYSAEAVVRHGRLHDNQGWDHAPGSNVIAWVKRAVNSPLVYIQPGDSAEVYADPHYRRLIANALRWLASPAAKAWARR